MDSLFAQRPSGFLSKPLPMSSEMKSVFTEDSKVTSPIIYHFLQSVQVWKEWHAMPKGHIFIIATPVTALSFKRTVDCWEPISVFSQSVVRRFCSTSRNVSNLQYRPSHGDTLVPVAAFLLFTILLLKVKHCSKSVSYEIKDLKSIEELEKYQVFQVTCSHLSGLPWLYRFTRFTSVMTSLSKRISAEISVAA